MTLRTTRILSAALLSSASVAALAQDAVSLRVRGTIHPAACAVQVPAAKNSDASDSSRNVQVMLECDAGARVALSAVGGALLPEAKSGEARVSDRIVRRAYDVTVMTTSRDNAVTITVTYL